MSGQPLQQRRDTAWLLAGLLALALVLVPWLKRLSVTSCPWDLLPYGGTVPYGPHWPWRLADGGAGHCLPSGHAVAAFAYFGLYFEWRPHRPQAARRALLAVLLIGGLFGWAQMARGAHFLSHIGWSAWI